MSEDIIYTFAITSKTYSTNNILSTPIVLEQNKYDYYLRLNTMSFSKVSPNITSIKSLKIDNDTYNFEPGLYDFDDIKNVFDTLTNNKLTLEFNNATGKAIIKNNIQQQGVTCNLIIDDNSILSKKTGILNFNNITRLFDVNVPSIKADEIVKIEDYNNYWVSSNLINACSYQLDENMDVLHLGTVLCVLPSNAKPYEFKNFFSPQVLDYKISANVIDRICFSITKEYFKELPLLEGSETDLSICVQLVRKTKQF